MNKPFLVACLLTYIVSVVYLRYGRLGMACRVPLYGMSSAVQDHPSTDTVERLTA